MNYKEIRAEIQSTITQANRPDISISELLDLQNSLTEYLIDLQEGLDEARRAYKQAEHVRKVDESKYPFTEEGVKMGITKAKLKAISDGESLRHIEMESECNYSAIKDLFDVTREAKSTNQQKISKLHH